jgi:ATP-dependent DNA helicase DinG
VMHELNEELTDLYQVFKQEYPTEEDRLITKAMIDQLSLAGEQVLQRTGRLYQDVLILGERLQEYYELHKETFSIKEQAEWNELQLILESLQQQQIAFDCFSERWDARYIHWFNGKRKTFHVQDLEASLISDTKWYGRINKFCTLVGH